MDNSHKQSDQYNAALPLPGEVNIPHEPKPDKKESNAPAADIIRKRIKQVYSDAPSLTAETQEITQLEQDSGLSKHQQFILDITNSGKSLKEIQAAWKDYYEGLPDDQKHQVWQEFYSLHEHASAYSDHAPAAKAGDEQATKVTTAKVKPPRKPATTVMGKRVEAARAQAGRAIPKRAKQPLKSLGFGISIGCIVLLIFLFSFFNERFIAPFIQPSRIATNAPIITGDTTTISSAPELIIPKINVQIPIIYATDNSDNTIENDLESGVVHYADTAMPGQNGNLVIFGHSSNNIFNPGKYKFAFVLLHQLSSGDTFYIDNNGVRYTYEVYQTQIVSPDDVSVLDVTSKPATATLITCDPPGTSINRLVVSAEQIDPSLSSNTAQTTNNQQAISETTVLPGNSPTLWSRILKWLES